MQKDVTEYNLKVFLIFCCCWNVNNSIKEVVGAFGKGFENGNSVELGDFANYNYL